MSVLGLASLAMAVDYEFWSDTGCSGTLSRYGTLHCGANGVPVSPPVGGYKLIYANGQKVQFYDSKYCAGTPWFIDDGTGGCITDSRTRTNCIYVPC